MGNDLWGTPVGTGEMAATNHSVGIAHPTVVPENAAARREDEEEDADTGTGQGKAESDA